MLLTSTLQREADVATYPYLFPFISFTSLAALLAVRECGQGEQIVVQFTLVVLSTYGSDFVFARLTGRQQYGTALLDVADAVDAADETLCCVSVCGRKRGSRQNMTRQPFRKPFLFVFSCWAAYSAS